jgi:trans-aconitate methyltransferase
MQSRANLGHELLNIATAFRASALIQAAVQLDLFSFLRPQMGTIHTLAGDLGIAPLSLSLMIKGLQAIGILHEESNRCSLASALEPLYELSVLHPDGEVSANQRENWVWLEIASILNKTLQAPDSYKLELLRGNIMKFRGIQSMNAALGCGVLRQIETEISSAKRILDIGGGDGIFSDLILSTYPLARVDVLELPEGAAPCRFLQQQKPHADLRIILADARSFEATCQYDVIIINELLELFSYADKVAIVRHAVLALAPNGCLLITKFELDDSGLNPTSAAIFSLRMRLKSEASYLETNQEVVDLLTSNGLAWIETHCINGIKTTFKARRSPPLPCSSVNSHFDTYAISNLTTVHPMEQSQLGLWQELMAITTAYRVPSILFAALELRIVDAISTEGSTIEQIHQQLGNDDVGVELIVKALTAVGVFGFHAGRYSIDPGIRDLLGSSDASMAEEVLQFKHENQIWLELATIVKESRGLKESTRRILETDNISCYLSNVSAANQGTSLMIGAKLKQLNIHPSRFIDIGAGNGDFTIQLCADFPEARGTVLDLPHVIAHHHSQDRRNSEWAQRVDFQAADICCFESSDNYDLAVISDLLHYYPRSLKIRIIQNAMDMLGDRGTLVIHKFSLNAQGTEPLSAALLSLKFNLKRAGAYLETDQEALDMLKQCGLELIDVSTFDSGKTLMIASKS